MGKFSVDKFEEREIHNENMKKRRMKESFREKPLLQEIPFPRKKGDPIEDGVLLFGKFSGKKISELLNSYEDSSYVTNFLLKNKDFPRDFRKRIEEIIDNSDPFSNTNDEDEDDFLKIKNRFSVKRIIEDSELEIIDETGVPW